MSTEAAGLDAQPVEQNTQSGRLRFLLVEDNPVDIELLERALHRAGFEFTSSVVQTREEFALQLRASRPHVVLADYNLPQWKGMEALEIIHREGLDIPLILVTGALGEMTAVDCIKQGATDYVLKGALTRLPIVIRRALQEKSLRDQRQRAEDDLARKVEELARSNRDLEQFAYVASHDLQEPLRMVAAYTQLLGKRYRGRLDENADKYIAYAVEGALRMQTLILDLLAFSRVGRAEPGSKKGDCNAAFRIALANLHTAIAESGAVITRDELPTVAVDPTQLVQLFQNLIGNAIKFRGKEAPLIRVSAEKQDSAWLLTVADNGIGISPHAMGGSLTTLGYSASRKTTIDVTDLIWKQASIQSFVLFAQPQAAWTDAWNTIVRPLRSGAIKPIVAKTFPLAEAANALRYLVEDRPFGRVVLTI